MNWFIITIFVVTLWWIISKAKRANMLEKEVEWMHEAITDENYRKTWIAKHKKFYNYIRQLLREEKIKKSMTIEEIYKIIETDKNAPDDFRTYMYFGNDKKKDDKIILRGYGDSIPTPELILKICNGKLVGWKGSI